MSTVKLIPATEKEKKLLVILLLTFYHFQKDLEVIVACAHYNWSILINEKENSIQQDQQKQISRTTTFSRVDIRRTLAPMAQRERVTKWTN